MELCRKELSGGSRMHGYTDTRPMSEWRPQNGKDNVLLDETHAHQLCFLEHLYSHIS